jgi:DNA adenine methylase
MKPFVKWVGSKTKVLPHLLSRLPDLTNTVYVEPFIGSGVVFANVPGARIYYLYDANAELINLFEAVQLDALELIESLYVFSKAHSPNYFKEIRKTEFNSRVLSAARFIYLNKTCFNGLYRVNKKGKFNVPIGSYKNPRILDAENLRSWNLLLNQKPTQSKLPRLYNFGCRDFRFIRDCFGIAEKTFCYCDPPFDSVFSSYTSDGFTQKDQIDLHDCLKEREKINDFKWMMSNSSTPFILDLYKDYNIEVIPTTKSVKGGRPQKFDEVIIRNY